MMVDALISPGTNPVMGVPPIVRSTGPATTVSIVAVTYGVAGVARMPLTGKLTVNKGNSGMGMLAVVNVSGPVPLRKPSAMMAGALTAAVTAPTTSPVCTAWTRPWAALAVACRVVIGAPMASAANADGSPRLTVIGSGVNLMDKSAPVLTA